VASPLRVLVAVDFSAQSLAAVRVARSLVQRTDGILTFVHVRPSSDVRAAVAEERGALLRGDEGDLARAMAAYYDQRFEKSLRRRKVEAVRLLRGEPARELCREACRGYDLLVMGTHGRGRAAAFLLGSTVQEVLVRSPIPLVIVPQKRAP
jgi:nucleotide-binding universal stress UspA family protein